MAHDDTISEKSFLSRRRILPTKRARLGLKRAQLGLNRALLVTFPTSLTSLPLFRGRFWRFQAKIKYNKISKTFTRRAASDRRTLFWPVLVPVYISFQMKTVVLFIFTFLCHDLLGFLFAIFYIYGRPETG